MPTIRDFKVGDRIQNSYYCSGIVTSIKDDTLIARYTERNQSWSETYDANWFKKYGEFLKKLPRLAKHI